MQNSKNTAILKYGLIAALTCLIISIFVYFQFFLNEPVFLKHYYELVIHENSRINLHLITNSNDDRRILKIKFPQMPKDFAYMELDYFNIGNDGYLRSQKFAHYNYNELVLDVVSLYEEVENNISEKSVVLEKAVIYYNNGDEQEVDIGKIVLHKNINRTDDLTSIFSKSSSNNTSAVSFKSKDNLIIDSITSELDEDLGGVIELKMNDTVVSKLNYPINIPVGDSLNFESKFNFEPENAKKYNVYNIQKRISLIDSKGNNETERILNLDYYPGDLFRTERGIIQYLKEIGVR